MAYRVQVFQSGGDLHCLMECEGLIVVAWLHALHAGMVMWKGWHDRIMSQAKKKKKIMSQASLTASAENSHVPMLQHTTRL
jgi:hypothetical protein